jgi:hypothetical protein
LLLVVLSLLVFLSLLSLVLLVAGTLEAR